MSKHALLVAAALMLAAPLPARAQEGTPAVVVNALELSGDGAIAGNNFNNGVLLAFKEINAAGGILGRKIDVVTLDIETKPEVAKAALAKATELQAFAVMGPMFSGIVAGRHGGDPAVRAPDLRRRGGRQRHRARQSLRLPHVAVAVGVDAEARPLPEGRHACREASPSSGSTTPSVAKGAMR